MKSYFLAILLFFTLISAPSAFADVSTTGFIPGTIWYSTEPLVEGETVKIFTAVWNGDTNPLSAKVEFYDKNVILGSREIVVPAQTVKDVSVSWKVTAGDHIVSAKIVSSKITEGGKAEPVVLERRDTGEDRKFVSKIITTIDGNPVSSSVVIKDQVEQASSKITNILPESVTDPVSDAFSSLDELRDETFTKIATVKEETKKQIDALKKNSTQSASNAGAKNESASSSKAKSSSGVAGAEGPIASVKLFFLTILGFIFGNKIVFYGICGLILFIIIRFIYRKIRGI